MVDLEQGGIVRHSVRWASLSIISIVMILSFQNCGKVGKQDSESQLPGDIVIEAAAKSCVTPWGATLNHNDSVKAFSLVNGQCKEEMRGCQDGQLSGTYSAESCLGAQTINCGESLHPNTSTYKSCGGLIEGTVLGLSGDGISGQFAYSGSIVMTQKYNCDLEKYEPAQETSNTCCVPAEAYLGGQNNNHGELYNVNFTSCEQAVAAQDNLKITASEAGPLSHLAKNCCSGRARVMKVVGDFMQECNAKSQAVVLCE